MKRIKELPLVSVSMVSPFLRKRYYLKKVAEDKKKEQKFSNRNLKGRGEEMTSVSLCMIVKNEEQFLETCLKSIKNYVDEIIVVDTGSTDRTMEIALNHGARLESFQWNGDFSAARNYAKSFATKDWILQLDADEYFLPGEAEKLNVILSKTTKDSISIQVNNRDDFGNIGITHYISRIFRNKPEFKYVRRIHEQMMNGEAFLTYEKVSLSIEHVGYTKQTSQKKNKSERNLNILLEEYKDNPTDSFTMLNLANQYNSMEKYKEVQRFAQSSFNEGAGMIHRPFALFRFIDATVRLNQWDKALEIANEGERIMGHTSGDILHYKALISDQLGYVQEAIYWYEKRLARTEIDEIQWFERRRTKIELAKLYMRTRNMDRAIHLMEQIVKENPYDIQQTSLYFDLLSRRLTLDELILKIKTYFGTNSAKDQATCFKIALSIRNYSLLEMNKVTIEANQFSLYESAFAIPLQNENYLSSFEQRLKKHMIKGDLDARVSCILFVLKYPSPEIISLIALDKTADFLYQTLQKGVAQISPKRIDYTLVDALAQELVAQNRIHEANILFDHINSTKTTFAEILDYYEYDDVAISFYIERFKQNYKNTQGVIRLVELLYASDLVEEGILFLEKNNEFPEKNARVYELLLIGYKKMGKTNEMKRCQAEAKQRFKTSSFFKTNEVIY